MGRKANFDKSCEKIPTAVGKQIKDFIVPEFHKLAYEDREKLLPAVIPIDKTKIKKLLHDVREKCNKIYNSYCRLPRDHQALFQLKGHRPLYALFQCREQKSNETNVFEYDLFTRQQNPQYLYIKNQTPPHTILGRTIGVGEFVLIGYTDGDIQILLNDSDRRTLNNLSYEQREFIKGLYHRGGSCELSLKQMEIFESLPQEVQTCLKEHHWSISIAGQKDNQSQIVNNILGAGAIFLSIERMRQSTESDNAFRIPWFALSTIYYLKQLHVTDRTRKPEIDDAWKTPIVSLIAFEGLKLLGKLANNFLF